jgi:hypothetical protein
MNSNSWRILAQNITDRKSLAELRVVLDKIEKCCVATDNSLNLADIVEDRNNKDALIRTFGGEGFDVGIQTVLRLSLQDYATRSFVLNAEISGKIKINYLYNMMKNYKFFDIVMTLMFPSSNSLPAPVIKLINPLKKQFWDEITSIPCGTLISFYAQKRASKKKEEEEKQALDQFQTLFENVQSMSDEEIMECNVISMAAAKPKRTKSCTIKPSTGLPSYQEPVEVMRVTVNKMDTFVHAGNAHLIIEVSRDYPGRIMMFVLRDKKQTVILNIDSIWSAEIRNGETVVYEFYGPVPADDFMRELSRATNKYTQMDKVANE